MVIQERNKKKFVKLIWDFYAKHKRVMPWRGEKDPYKVLVSEIMLQQTQVSRVMEKYTEFLKAFPTIHSLAKAPLSKVIVVWQGLGYNRRAKFLHQFAQVVVKKYGGKIPSDPSILITLPGIGKATAGSLAAFGFNLPVPFIETNIRRVYIHHFFPKKKTVSDADLLPIIAATVDKKKAREWYYALMDYGAYLKTQGENPNRKSKHYTKQSTFVGSNREVRGAILRVLSRNASMSTTKLTKELTFEKGRIEKALEGLIGEGFVVKKKGNIILV